MEAVSGPSPTTSRRKDHQRRQQQRLLHPTSIRQSTSAATGTGTGTAAGTATVSVPVPVSRNRHQNIRAFRRRRVRVLFWTMLYGVIGTSGWFLAVSYRKILTSQMLTAPVPSALAPAAARTGIKTKIDKNTNRNRNMNSSNSTSNSNSNSSNNGNSTTAAIQRRHRHSSPREKERSNCAIGLFGLPRSFKKYVLPSLEANVIRPNAAYGCDYFVHYYKQDSEEAGRSGRGGSVRPDDVLLLRGVVETVHNEHWENRHQQQRPATDTINDGRITTTTTAAFPLPTMPPPMPTVAFVSDTNETFWDARFEHYLKRYRMARDKDTGNYLFYPYKEPTYEYPGTLDNIIRQWHSVQAVWEAMEGHQQQNQQHQHQRKKHQQTNKRYDRVAMLRNDVVYITPIDIYRVPELGTSTSSKGGGNEIYSTSVVPGFAKYPVNDRMIYGPYEAVEIWASKRFENIELYATDPNRNKGMVLHSETFLNASIFEAIKGLGSQRGETETETATTPATVEKSSSNSSSNATTLARQARNVYRVVEDPWICFLRVRADGAVWIEDCDPKKSGFGGGYPGGEANYTDLLTKFLPNHGKRCRRRLVRDKQRRIVELACS
ncbi:unnamed protein product [Pseudo-nitzschia multistriata]|uniref:Uncharacterized protein n=1 Tax=Pseudo-nitzschia multistriata TaxID=183589 RepID=A0A448ZS18_9STRA|nr:unnamed protein product [Pseudo-nitzschia multistriata]